MKPGSAGSTLWMLRHELRLQWRSTGSKLKVNTTVAAVLVLLFFHLVAYPLALGARYMSPLPIASIYELVTGGALFVFLMMMSAALVAAVQAIFARGDIDLMLSSPIPPHSIILVRAGAVALTAVGGSAILGLPFANVLGLMVTPRWFVAYLALPALALLATAVSLLVALGLFRLMGARRTRIFAQILGGLLGIAAFLLMQLPNLLRTTGSDAAATRRLEDLFAGIPLPAPESLLWLPARALMGEPLPLAVGLLLSVGLFALVAHGLAGRFIASMTAAGASQSGRPRRRTASRPFRTGTVSVMRRKELRLIARDPGLVTKIMQQAIYLVPLAAMAWKYGIHNIALSWLILVLIAGNLAAAFGWLAVSGEDAPDLLSASPLRPADMLRAKLEAALLPVGVALLMPIVAAGYIDAWLGLTLATCCTGAALSCATLQLLNPNPGKRSEFNKRANGRWAMGIAELLLSAGWAATAAGMLAHSPWALIGPPLLLGLPVFHALLKWLDDAPLAAKA